MRALHASAYHGNENTLRCISKRFWLPYVRSDVSAFVNNCVVCDRDRYANHLPRAPFEHLLTDLPFACLYIDIELEGQISLSFGLSPKSILTMVDGLTGWAKATLIADQGVVFHLRLLLLRDCALRSPRADTLLSRRGLYLRFSKSCAQRLALITRSRLRISRKQLAYLRVLTVFTWRCCVALLSKDSTTKNRCCLLWCRSTAWRYLRHPVLHLTASCLAAKCSRW